MRCTLLATTAWTAALPGLLCGQTAIDLGAQSRNVDFSAAATTRPFKTGAVVPSACNTGETFFKTDAPAGQNLYACTATNTWTPMTVTSSNSGLAGVEVLKNQAGAVIGRRVQGGEGNVLTQQTDTITLETDTAITPRYALAATPPSGSCQTGRDVFTRVSGFPHFYGCVDGAWKPVYEVTTTAPASCYVGEIYFNASDSGIYGCTITNQWTRLNKIGVDISAAGECFITYNCTPTGAFARQTVPSAGVAGKMIAVRTIIPYTIRLKRGLTFLGFASSSTSAFTAAVYNDNNGAPGTKIAGTDLRYVDLAATAYRTELWGTGAVILQPGVYWIGYSSEDNTTQVIIAGQPTSSVGTMLSRLTVNRPIVACSNAVSGTGTGYTLPASCGTTADVPSFVDAPILVAAAQ